MDTTIHAERREIARKIIAGAIADGVGIDKGNVRDLLLDNIQEDWSPWQIETICIELGYNVRRIATRD